MNNCTQSTVTCATTVVELCVRNTFIAEWLSVERGMQQWCPNDSSLPADWTPDAIIIIIIIIVSSCCGWGCTDTMTACLWASLLMTITDRPSWAGASVTRDWDCIRTRLGRGRQRDTNAPRITRSPSNRLQLLQHLSAHYITYGAQISSANINLKTNWRLN